MLSKQDILDCFAELNEGLRQSGQSGEIGIVGGAVMCLVYNARKATRDVDAIFEPSSVIRSLAASIGERRGLDSDWLNDGAKGYLVKNFKREDVLVLSNLLIWAPEARYMLAMKCISARWDSSDKDDVIFLLKYLQISEPSRVFDLLQHYYPNEAIPSKTQFFIEEVLEQS